MTRDEAYYEADTMDVTQYDGMRISRLICHLLDEVGRLEVRQRRKEARSEARYLKLVARQQKQIEDRADKATKP